MTRCIFCGIVAGKLPASKVYEDEQFLAFMDIYPMRPGHILVIPKAHAQYVAELSREDRCGLLDTGSRIAQALRQSSLLPAAIHFAINDGVAAHQSVPHVHLHLLPRYRQDSWRLIGSALLKPIQMLLRPTARDILDTQAEEIRRVLSQTALSEAAREPLVSLES